MVVSRHSGLWFCTGARDTASLGSYEKCDPAALCGVKGSVVSPVTTCSMQQVHLPLREEKRC